MTAMLALLLTRAALAGDPPTDALTPPPTVATASTPTLAEGINKVAAGVVLLNPDGTTAVVPVKSWLLPDSYYREAITKARQLAIYEPALETCTQKALEHQALVESAVDSCTAQFESDAALITSLTRDIGTLETRALTAESLIRDLRTQRNTAWAITGGLVLGAAAVTAVAIAP